MSNFFSSRDFSFLAFYLRETWFQFRLLLLRLPWFFVALTVGGVGFWLALSFAFHPRRWRSSIALWDRLPSQIPRSDRQLVLDSFLCFLFSGFFFMYMCAKVCTSHDGLLSLSLLHRRSRQLQFLFILFSPVTLYLHQTWSLQWIHSHALQLCFPA